MAIRHGWSRVGSALPTVVSRVATPHSGRPPLSRSLPADAPARHFAFDCASRQIQRIVLTYTPHSLLCPPGKRTLRIESGLSGSLGHQVSDEDCCDSRAETYPSEYPSATHRPRADRPRLSVPRSCLPIFASVRERSPLPAHVRTVPRGHGRGWDSLPSHSAPRPLSSMVGCRAFFRASAGQAIGPSRIPEQRHENPAASPRHSPGNSGDPSDPASRWPHRT